jgi:hypothetical protein
LIRTIMGGVGHVKAADGYFPPWGSSARAKICRVAEEST